MNAVQIEDRIVKRLLPSFTLIKPHILADIVGEYVIENEEAIQVISTAVYNHYKRLIYNKTEVEIEKSNVLLLGGTGSGKTYIAKTICKCLNVPYYIGDASTLTASGYVGSDVETLLSGLLLSADGDIESAQRGVLIIDEIDKITNKEENISITRDVSGIDVQYELLKIMEGTILQIQPGEKRKHPEKPTIPFDTTNVLFICMGAFEGIEKIIEKRLNIRKIGYNEDKQKTSYEADKVFTYVNQDDIRTYGLIREMIGRLPIITSTDILSKETLKNILTKPKNSIIKQYQELFRMDNCELTFEEEALDTIAEYSIQNKSGARSLRATLEKILQWYMFNIPKNEEKKVHLTKDIVKEKLKIE
jgi:ATP-dependent Clp protease ATP-binding subunit ClpX